MSKIPRTDEHLRRKRSGRKSKGSHRKRLILHGNGGVYMYMKKFDARVRPSTRVLTSHWGWRIVEEVDETRYWVKLVGMVGRLRYSEVFKQEPMTGMFCYQKIAGNRARLS